MISKSISVNPLFVVFLLGMTALCLVFVGLAGQLAAYFLSEPGCVYKPLILFDLSEEQSIPTCYSSFLLLFAACLLSVITARERTQRAAYLLHWEILSLGFLVMAIDEIVSLHERLAKPTRHLLLGDHFGIFYFTWVIPGIIMVMILALFFRNFLRQLPHKPKVTFLIAAILYISGCIGFEMMGGKYAEIHGLHNLTFNILSIVEESLEMAGVIIFIWGLLEYIADNYREVTFHVESTKNRNPFRNT